MADVVTPEQFNEQFTLYLNTKGEPVQRTLREMTADEVLAAERWQLAEADRLERDAGRSRRWPRRSRLVFASWPDARRRPQLAIAEAPEGS